MFRIAFLLALVSTSAIACEEFDVSCKIGEQAEKNYAEYLVQKRHDDEMFMRQREYDQRERLADDVDRRQQLIQGQLNQLNMNTTPRY